MLQLSAVDVRYNGVQALRGVSLAVGPGEVVALLGANGAGKSTTLRAISGVIAPSAGTITWQGIQIDRLPVEQIVRLGIAHVPEGRQIFPELTVEENLVLGSYGRRDRGALRDDLTRIFQRFPILAERRKLWGASLSGGEQQLLAIARGLMASPRLLLLDEPSLGLAPKTVQEIFRVVRALREDGIAVLLVEQNAHLALGIAHRAYLLEAGRVVLSGTASALRQDPAVRRSYLGDTSPNPKPA